MNYEQIKKEYGYSYESVKNGTSITTSSMRSFFRELKKLPWEEYVEPLWRDVFCISSNIVISLEGYLSDPKDVDVAITTRADFNTCNEKITYKTSAKIRLYTDEDLEKFLQFIRNNI